MFMKHKLLYLFTLLFMATNVVWGQNNPSKSPAQLTFKGTEEDVNSFKTSMGITQGSWVIIYGNGYPMTIEKTLNATSDNQITVTFDGQEAPDPISLTGEEKAIIFGGSKEADLDGNTSITLKSGNVGYIIGGGWGTKGKTATDPKTANVKDVSIDIQAGYVDLIYSGGLYRANVDNINLNIKNAVIGHIYCGGFDQGQTSNTIETEWDNSVNHIVSSTLNMDHATVEGYLFLGGGQGYSYSKEVMATISNSTLYGGILGIGSNGRSNKVIATISGCTFERIPNGDVIEIAPINRGYVKEVDMTFDGCTFPQSSDDYKSYLGATYCYDGKSKAEADKVGLHFIGCTNTPEMWLSHGLENADVTLTGTQAVVGTTYETSTKTLNAYTIATGKEWILEGIRYDGEATLTNDGSLSVTCSTVKDLVAAVKAQANTITLNAGTYSLTSQLQISNSLNITGAGKTETIITADKSWTGGEDAKDLIKVAVADDNTPATLSLLRSNKKIAEDVSLSALTIKGAQGNGLVASSPVKLTDVALTDNKASGLFVSSTTVTATNLTTSGNGESGVKVEKGIDNLSTTKLTVNGTSNLGEMKKIVANDKNLVEGDYVEKLTATDGDNNEKIYGIKSNLTLVESKDKDNQGNVITYVYANGTPVTIKVDPEDSEKIGIYENNKLIYTLPGKNTQLFGGSNNSDNKTTKIASTHITMESGTISAIYGGGDNTEVENANITITGGEITDKLFGGGRGTSSTIAVTGNIKFNLSNAKIRYMVCGGKDYATVNSTQAIINDCIFDYVLGGGFAPVGNDVTIDSEANTVKQSNILMTGGIINGALLAGGGYSYAHTETASATLNNVTVNGGLYGAGFNGKSDNVTIEANECEFKHKADDDYRTIAALVRGKMETVKMTFDEKCSFDNGYECYIGADQNSENATSANNATFIFKGENVPIVKVSGGLQNVEVSGAKVMLDAFVQDNKTTVTAFTIPQGKNWIFKKGFEIVKANNEDSQATLTYAANATGETKAGTLTVGGTMTPAKEKDVTTALKGETPSASIFDVTGLQGWTSDKLAEKLNEKFYVQQATEGKRTEPFSGIKFICKDGENTVTIYSDKEAANTDDNPDAKYLVWDATNNLYLTGKDNVETKQPLSLTIIVSGGSTTDITSVKANNQSLTATEGKYSVYAGQKLIITFRSKDGYSVSAKIGGKNYQNGSEYIVPGDGEALEMKITYTYNYVPDDPTTSDPDPNPTEEVKISFDTTEKTVKVGDEFTLKATITGAESNQIVWTSSDSNVATITNDGKVKAVGIGTATITARIGDVEATCALTVEAQPTGIEAVSAGTKLYTIYGQIVIIPAESVQVTVHAVTGVCIYTGRISEALYIPASAGIYLVTLSTGEGEAIEKVSVR